MLWPRVPRFGWDPWSEVRRLQREMDRLFERFADGSDGRRFAEFPPVNVLRGKDDVVVTAELPGVGPKDLDISVRGNTLVVRGRREPEELSEGETWHRRERTHGDFVRTVRLPHEVDADKVEASYRHGILRVTLPRTEADKPKQITISSA